LPGTRFIVRGGDGQGALPKKGFIRKKRGEKLKKTRFAEKFPPRGAEGEEGFSGKCKSDLCPEGRFCFARRQRNEREGKKAIAAVPEVSERNFFH